MAEPRTRFILYWLGPSWARPDRFAAPLGRLDAADTCQEFSILSNISGIRGNSGTAARRASLGPETVPQCFGDEPRQCRNGIQTSQSYSRSGLPISRALSDPAGLVQVDLKFPGQRCCLQRQQARPAGRRTCAGSRYGSRIRAGDSVRGCRAGAAGCSSHRHRPPEPALFCGARTPQDSLRFDLDGRDSSGGECVAAGLK